MSVNRRYRRHSRSPAKRRDGYALVVFALMSVVLLGLAALAIDLGTARLTRLQMKSAVDAAALEGARQRAIDGDEAGRMAASKWAALAFDSDLDLVTQDSTYGAGPRIDFASGVPISPEFNAAQTITIPPSPLYKPSLQTNESNDQRGDVVFGTYSDGDGVDHRAGYDRGDFTPSDGDALLVRMRRTDELLPSGVADTGGRVPYLFGRGSLLGLDARGRGIAVRATSIATSEIELQQDDGSETIPIGNAKAVGVALPAELWEGFAGLVGAAPFAIEVSFWNQTSASAESPTELLIDEQGAHESAQIIRVAALASDVSATESTINVNAADGFPVNLPPFNVRIGHELLTVLEVDGAEDTEWTVERGVGETAAAAYGEATVVVLQRGLGLGSLLDDIASQRVAELADDAAQTESQFVPIFADVEIRDTQHRVVMAFGRAQWNWDSDGNVLQVHKTTPVTAGENVSATVAADIASGLAQRLSPPLTQSETETLVAEILRLNLSQLDFLRAYLLVR